MNNDYEIRGKDTVIFLPTSKENVIETIISTDDLERVQDFVGTWLPRRSGNTYYVQGHGGRINEEKRNVSLHRWITDAPEHLVVDHINHNTLDNRFVNLRVVSQSANLLNRKKKTGVVKYKDKWKGQLMYKGERILVGYFSTKKEAREAVESLRQELLIEDEFQSEWEQELMFFNEQVRGLHPNA